MQNRNKNNKEIINLNLLGAFKISAWYENFLGNNQTCFTNTVYQHSKTYFIHIKLRTIIETIIKFITKKAWFEIVKRFGIFLYFDL